METAESSLRQRWSPPSCSSASWGSTRSRATSAGVRTALATAAGRRGAAFRAVPCGGESTRFSIGRPRRPLSYHALALGLAMLAALARPASCAPSAPSILSASAPGPEALALAVSFTAGEGVTAVEVTCAGPGGPYAASSPVTDAAAGGTAVSVAVALSYGGSYSLACAAVARAGSTPSAASPPSTVSVPAGNAIAAQSALMPSSDPPAANAFLRVGASLLAEESVEIVYVAPIANYLLGQRSASHRVGLVQRSKRDYRYCEYDLDACRCNFVVSLASGLNGVKPTDFAYTSMTPWAPKDPDWRPDARQFESHRSQWHWSDYAYANRADLLGAPAAERLKKPNDCGGTYACYTYAAQRWSTYAFASCTAAPYGPIKEWTSPSTCPGADAYGFMTAAATWQADFRHFRAAYERNFYEAVSGISSASPSEIYEWSALLGTLLLFRPLPTGSNGDAAAHRARHFRLQPELVSFASSSGAGGAAASSSVAFGSHYFQGATNCLDFYDAEPDGRTMEGNETAADAQLAYGEDFAGLLLQDQRLFSFWQRGVAFFGSFAAIRSNGPGAVLPLIKACSLPMGVALLKFDLAAVAATIAATGYSATDASAVFASVPWPGADPSSLADAFPPGASVHALHADGRVASGGPVLFHAIVRIPFFPTSAGACPSNLLGDVCPSRSITHVIAMFTWSVSPAAFTTEAAGMAARKADFPVDATYRRAVVAHDALVASAKVLRTEAVALRDHWIIQNERPLHAGPGYGYLEGRWVDPPNAAARFAFYVTGDRVVRVTKVNSYQSGMAGSKDGEIQIYGPPGWRGTRAEWTSVAAAVYKDGTLYVVQEVHTPNNTRVFTFASTSDTRPGYSSSKRMRRSNERASCSCLLRIANVNAPSFADAVVTVVVPNFPANIISASVVDDYSSGQMFDLNPYLAFSEMPWVVFVVAQPATVIKLHHRCPPGQRWNWEAAVFNRSTPTADLCVNLPAGRYSPDSGLLLDTEAPLCDAGYYSSAGSTTCSRCDLGTFSAAGASSCYDCPANTHALENFRTQGCMPCPETRTYTPSSRWTFTCIPCLPGMYLPHVGATTCFACPPNQFSSPILDGLGVVGAWKVGSCQYCNQGYYPRSDLTDCEACPKGQYQAANNTPCVECPPGMFSDAAGTFGSCKSCDPVRDRGVVVNANKDGCAMCLAGWGLRAGGVECEACDVDYVSADGTNCTRCGRGSVSNTDRTRCLSCPEGTYEPDDRSGQCVACPINSVAPLPGSTACAPCNPGEVSSADGRFCRPCSAGTYRGANMTSCASVPFGYMSLAGAATPVRCADGFYPNLERSDCYWCPKGTYERNRECVVCPINAIAPELNSTACTPCRAGEYSTPDFQSCLPCPGGTHRPLNESTCLDVPADAAAPPGSANYAACGAGWVPNQQKTECTICRKGTFENATECQLCPLNAVSSAEGASSCTPCALGQVASPDQQTCLDCPVGTYRSALDADCVPVPKRAAALTGSPAYTPCSAGYVPSPSRAECQPCPAGWFQANDTCYPCPLNTFAGSAGSTGCAACAAGKVAAADGAACIDCDTGTYRALGMPTCRPVPSRAVAPKGSPMYTNCTAGTVPSTLKSECTPCPSGTFQAGDTCAVCPMNYVSSPNVSPPGCTPCPDGTTAAADGATCNRCPTGTYRRGAMPGCLSVPSRSVAGEGSANFSVCAAGAVPDGLRASCRSCASGSYQINDVCLPCKLNAIAPRAGAAECSVCPPGQVAAASGQACERCPFGTYRSVNDTNCIPVPSRAVAMEGSSNYTTCSNGSVPNGIKSACEPCRAGAYQVGDICVACPLNAVAPRPGASSCADCAEGYFATADSQSCIPCLGGFYRHWELPVCTPVGEGQVAMPASRNFTQCSPGTVPNFELTSCTPCPKGTYESGYKCVDCVGNTYAPSRQMTACLDCDPGTVADPDQQGCSPCTSGFFRSADRPECEQCPFGTFANAPGLRQCTPCPPGTESDDDRVGCTACRAGEYARNATCTTCLEGTWSEAQAAECKACPEGYTSLADRTACTPCRAGSYKPKNMNLCLPCKAGTYAPKGTPDACLVCKLGYFANPDSTGCLPCDPGTYMPNGTQTCKKCPGGEYAPNPGTAVGCRSCGGGYVAAPDGRSCIPCPLGYYRPEGSDAGSCVPCGAATVSRAQGAAACEACPAGKVPRDDRADCKNCDPGTYPVDGLCARCPPRTTSRSGDANCTRCPSGHVSDATRTACLPCPPAQYLPEDGLTCLRCKVNTVSFAGSTGCAACAEGFVSDESQTVCVACHKGTYRNSTLDYCEPCASGFFAPEDGAAACATCQETQLCPVATSDPIDISAFKQLVAERISESLANLSPSELVDWEQAAASRRRGRRLFAADVWTKVTTEDRSLTLLHESLTYDTTQANISRPEIKTEEVAAKRLSYVFAVLIVVIGVLFTLVGIGLCVYLKTPRDEQAKAERSAKVAKLDVLYKSVVAEKLEEMGEETPEEQQKKGSDRLEEARAAEPAARDEEEGTVLGAAFTVVGFGLIAIAAGYVLLQYSIANYQIIQSLQPGASPTIGSIAGPFEVLANFAGFSGPCQVQKQSSLNETALDGRAGVFVLTGGVGPIDGAPAALADARANAARKTCMVRWRCSRCQLKAASNVTVQFRLAARLAFAVAVNFRVTLPTDVTLEGVVTPSSVAQFSVFRGTLPVTVPLSLTPLHFTDPRDGSPRYDASLRPADNRATERGEADFGLCSFTKPLSDAECAGESVGMQVTMDVANVYELVQRKDKATVVDTIANLASLSKLALAVGSQLVMAYFLAVQFSHKRAAAARSPPPKRAPQSPQLPPKTPEWPAPKAFGPKSPQWAAAVGGGKGKRAAAPPPPRPPPSDSSSMDAPSSGAGSGGGGGLIVYSDNFPAALRDAPRATPSRGSTGDSLSSAAARQTGRAAAASASALAGGGRYGMGPLGAVVGGAAPNIPRATQYAQRPPPPDEAAAPVPPSGSVPTVNL